IATEMGGVPEVVSDGVDGLLVPPGDPTALAGAIDRLAREPARRRALADAAVARARRLSQHEVSARLDGLYRELAAARWGDGAGGGLLGG
ncbi:glycosyltransferase, partial [Klebsiella pneumoniae]|uniref:glycosyltransferase n=1 Tax=Klebsiella pneumoniae TaxID=573 RepID=UPI0022475968